MCRVDDDARRALDVWLQAVEGRDEDAGLFSFPTDAVRDAYFDSIASRSEEDVRDLLRHFLMKTGSLGADELRLESLKHLRAKRPDAYVRATRAESYRRLLGFDEAGEPTWQGLTWVLDLLPKWPMQAIEVLESYFLAHMMQLPDGRIHGIGDAQELIRAMWIGNPSSGAEKLDVLFQLGPRRFEHLIDTLYAEMGYETTLTAPARDGGRDVEATQTVPGSRGRTLVECKLWGGPVGVPYVRSLLGVVAHERSTKGIIVAPGGFTRPARDFAFDDSRLELLDWGDLLPLLDQYLGADWGRKVDYYVTQSIRRASSAVS